MASKGSLAVVVSCAARLEQRDIQSSMVPRTVQGMYSFVVMRLSLDGNVCGVFRALKVDRLVSDFRLCLVRN